MWPTFSSRAPAFGTGQTGLWVANDGCRHPHSLGNSLIGQRHWQTSVLTGVRTYAVPSVISWGNCFPVTPSPLRSIYRTRHTSRYPLVPVCPTFVPGCLFKKPTPLHAKPHIVPHYYSPLFLFPSCGWRLLGVRNRLSPGSPERWAARRSNGSAGCPAATAVEWKFFTQRVPVGCDEFPDGSQCIWMWRMPLPHVEANFASVSLDNYGPLPELACSGAGARSGEERKHPRNSEASTGTSLRAGHPGALLVKRSPLAARLVYSFVRSLESPHQTEVMSTKWRPRWACRLADGTWRPSREHHQQ